MPQLPNKHGILIVLLGRCLRVNQAATSCRIFPIQTENVKLGQEWLQRKFTQDAA